MKKNYYETREANRVMRMLWKAAGADSYILERSTYSDQVKYTCLGGIIAATGLMAGIAGGYAFYTIFEEKGSSLENKTDQTVAVFSFVFGVLWGLMIFNLDRFIVSSTGKGDGTEAITWDELKGAFPRIVMGAILAVTISKPLEIRMFKSEIDVALRSEQIQKQNDYLKDIEANYAARLAAEKTKIENWKKEIETKEHRGTELQDLMNQEMNGGRGTAGYGPETKKLEEQVLNMKNEIKSIKAINQPLIDKSYGTLENFEAAKLKEIKDSEEAANGLDGLLARIKLSHKLAGDWITFFIMALFMAIELTPVFFKLMLTKTPYDFLEDNIKELMKAEEGILIEYNYYKDKKGQERDLVIHYAKEKLSAERKALLKAQQELTEYAVSKYTEEVKRKIDANPGEYIKLETELKTKDEA